MSSNPPPLPYKVLTGPDDRSFCMRVSDHLREGYLLHGPPSIAASDGVIIVAQAVVLPEFAQ